MNKKFTPSLLIPSLFIPSLFTPSLLVLLKLALVCLLDSQVQFYAYIPIAHSKEVKSTHFQCEHQVSPSQTSFLDHKLSYTRHI